VSGLKPVCISLFFGLSAICAHAEDEFEAIIRENNSEIKALHDEKLALEGAAEEADALFAWELSASIGALDDKSPSSDPSLAYDSLSVLSGGVTLGNRSRWGLETKFSLDSSGSIVDDSGSWLMKPSVELRLPLWSNAFGRQSLATHRSLSLQKRLEAISAELAYDDKLDEALILLWSTVLQKESLINQQATLNRVTELYKIALKKSQRNLEAASNFLQARSALEQAQLDLETARLKFSQLETLLKLVLSRFKDFVVPAYDFTKFKKLSLEDYVGTVSARERLVSLTQDLRLESAQVRIEDEKSRLDLIGRYAQTGADRRFGEATRDSLMSDQSTAFVGLQLSVPLDFARSSRARERQERVAKSAEARSAYYRREQGPVLVQDRVSQHNRLVELLELSRKLEKTQLEKLGNERSLLAQGRSSIYQVLQFELDLARAQGSKFSLALELEKIKRQLSLLKYKTYE
jgi:hypothetical protein